MLFPQGSWGAGARCAGSGQLDRKYGAFKFQLFLQVVIVNLPYIRKVTSSVSSLVRSNSPTPGEADASIDDEEGADNNVENGVV